MNCQSLAASLRAAGTAAETQFRLYTEHMSLLSQSDPYISELLIAQQALAAALFQAAAACEVE